jgi:hypothetical protein
MKFEEGKDYYLKDGAIVFTPTYLKRRGKCCGSGCLHCPFDPHHVKGTETLKSS